MRERRYVREEGRERERVIDRERNGKRGEIEG